MPSIVFERFRTIVNRDGDVTLAHDKLRFAREMFAHGLPAIPVLDVANVAGEIVDADGARVTYDDMVRSLRAAGHEDVFMKPVADCSGRGAHRLSVEAGGLRERDMLLDAPQFFGVLGQHQLADEYLLQPRLCQHPMLDEIASSSVNTVRIDTFLDDDGSVHSSIALLRVSDGVKTVDNLHAGGFVIDIDLATGALAPTAKQKIGPGGELFTSHPRSGFVFDGAVLPHWDALKETVAAAAKALQPLRLIGWDVAITPDGPVLVEANHQYDVFLMQDLAHGLRRTRTGQAALETLGLRRAMRGAPAAGGTARRHALTCCSKAGSGRGSPTGR